MNKQTIFCIDIKSFYASVECVDRGLSPFHVPLVVADKARGSGTIVLAVSPYLRQLGVPSRLRAYELKDIPSLIFARPRMQRYVEVSAEIISFYLTLVGEDDLHVYSIDEAFLDMTPYLHLYKETPLQIAEKIKKDVFAIFGLHCTIGIGDSLFLSKTAMDIEAKKNSTQLAFWTKEDVQTKLWPVRPLSRIWGIGTQYQKRLEALGIYTVEDLAQYPKKSLIDAFGIIGGQMHDHANGIDLSSIREVYHPLETSLSFGQILMRDYQMEEIPLLLREMLDDVLLRLKLHYSFCKGVTLSIGYSKAIRGGFSRQTQLDVPSDDADILYDAIQFLFYKFCKPYPIRSVAITLRKLTKQDYYQTNLFIPAEEQEKKRKLAYTIARIKAKYGQDAILRVDAMHSSSTIKERHKKIGGHAK